MTSRLELERIRGIIEKDYPGLTVSIDRNMVQMRYELVLQHWSGLREIVAIDDTCDVYMAHKIVRNGIQNVERELVRMEKPSNIVINSPYDSLEYKKLKEKYLLNKDYTPVPDNVENLGVF